MKKTIYAFLIVAIVATAVTLLIVKYPQSDMHTTVPSSDVILSDVPVETVPKIPLGKMPAGTKPAPAPETLIGTTWVWDKTVMSDGTIITPKKAGVFAIAFGSDGRLIGKTDCNGFFGSYTFGSDGVVAFGPLASTLMYCEGSQEGEFSKPFADVVRYSVEPDGNLTLFLKNDSGGIVLIKK